MRNFLEQTHATFPETNWKVLETLRNGNDETRRELADYLIQSYWPPVYAWLRRHQKSGVEAAELAQAFFSEVVLTRHIFDRADSDRGRLRDLMCRALKNFVRDQSRRSHATTQSVVEFAHLIAEEGWLEQHESESPEKIFDRRWALMILEQAIEQCQAYYEVSDNQAYWNAFDLRVLQPSIYGVEPVSREKIVQLFGFTNESHVSVAVHAVKARIRETMRRIIAQTVDNPADAAAEFDELSTLLD